jgi:hypothetical protein
MISTTPKEGIEIENSERRLDKTEKMMGVEIENVKGGQRSLLVVVGGEEQGLVTQQLLPPPHIIYIM